MSSSELTVQEISDAFIAIGASFGDKTGVEVVDESVVKVASGYWCGSTSQAILARLQLVHFVPDTVLSPRGKAYLWELFERLKKATP